MNQDAIDQAIKNIQMLLGLGNLEGALIILKKEIAPISSTLENSIILQSGSLTALMAKKAAGLIIDDGTPTSNYQVARNNLASNMQTLMSTVKSELEVKRIMGEYNSIYTVTSKDKLEKIQGTQNNLVPMKWIYECINASKSVCQVLVSNGSKGTGWMLKDGWMMTNNHVIGNEGLADESKIVFDFEEGLNGTNKQTFEYRLDPNGAVFSPIQQLDYAFIKVIDNPDKPIADWGFLEVDTFSVPQKNDSVAIIQHPNGEKKQIALTENKIVSVDGRKLFYLTDTQRGSSGAPVLNKEWKVVGLHHAGKTEEEGGIVINAATGEKAGANEGLLIKDVMADIERQRAARGA